MKKQGGFRMGWWVGVGAALVMTGCGGGSSGGGGSNVPVKRYGCHGWRRVSRGQSSYHPCQSGINGGLSPANTYGVNSCKAPNHSLFRADINSNLPLRLMFCHERNFLVLGTLSNAVPPWIARQSYNTHEISLK